MPIYEYRCRACGNTFEVIQKFTDEPLRKCERCSGDLEKLLSRTAFVLKGGGWASDAYGRAKGSSEGETKEPKPESDGEKPSSSGCASGGCGCKG